MSLGQIVKDLVKPLAYLRPALKVKADAICILIDHSIYNAGTVPAYPLKNPQLSS